MEKGAIPAVKRFYEAHPYPLQAVRTREDLRKNEHSRVMARILATVGWKYPDLRGRRVLDAGCGTGEKALFCAMEGAKADAFDISGTSIKIAEENARRLGLEADYTVQSYEEFESKVKYDLILCIGSLHHTSDAHANFSRMAALLAPKGRIALGLYNTYGRLGCRLHRNLLWAGEHDPSCVLEKLKLHEVKSETMRASLADRFGSPHETYHSIGEVLSWFKGENLLPISSCPAVDLSNSISQKAAELSWLAKGKGFFYIGAHRR